MQIGNVILYEPAAVCRKTVPDNQQGLMKVTHQGFQKVHDLLFPDRIGIDSKVEVPQSQSGGYRKALPIEVVLQDRCLSAGRPGATPMRSLA